MIKHYSFFANWRKKDVTFLNSLSLNRHIEEGFFGFAIEDENTYNKIMEYYSKKDSLFYKNRPEDFSCTFGRVSFSKKELDKAKYYELIAVGDSVGEPQPENYRETTFKYSCDQCDSKREQIVPFRILNQKWKKNQVNFAFDMELDFMFFKKDFYQEVLKPLGLKSKDLIDHKTGKVSDVAIQLDIPIAESKLLIEGTVYDDEADCLKCGVKQYSNLTKDFFPPFEKENNFLICKTQEEFLGAKKKIIISKEFCDLLLKHKIIKYNCWQITPLKIN